MPISYGFKTRLCSPRRVTASSLGILLICVLSSGCSSRAARPLTLAFGGLAFASTAEGLHELTDKLPTMTADEQKSQLRAFCDSGAEPQLKRKCAYVLARVLQRSGTQPDLKEAIKRYADASQFAPLWERCETHTAECAQALGDEKTVRTALEALKAKAQGKDARVAATYGLAQSYLRTGDNDKAKATFTEVIQIAPTSQFALGSTYYLAEMQLSGMQPASNTNSSPKPQADPPGDKHLKPVDFPETVSALPDNVLSAFRHYLTLSPDGHFASDVVSQLQKITAFQPTKDDYNLFARVYYAANDWRDALDNWKKSGNTSDWFKQAVCQARLGRIHDAKQTLTNGMKTHPNDQAVSAAAAMLARFTDRNGALAVWKNVLQHSPQFADIALYNIGIRANTPTAALPFYAQIIAHYPSSAYAPESAWWLAWHDVQAGKTQAALSELQAAKQKYASAKAGPRFYYWVGKMYERLGNKDQARLAYTQTYSQFPKSYYGHRAQSRLLALGGGKDKGWATNPQRKVHWTQDTADDWSFPEPPKQLAHEEGATVEALTELAQWDEALQALPGKNRLLKAFYFAKMNQPLDAINTAYPSLQGPPTHGEAWQLAYPLLYARTIATEAPAKHLDPLLVQALIREESRYNVQAVSGSNAIGLMQLMPATAYGVAKRLGIKVSNVDDIHRPENNIRLGVDYLSYVLDRFKGNALFAVASYNGGPNAVQHWSAHMPADTDVFVENIPFRETRDYVRKVFGSYWNYEAIYLPARTTAKRTAQADTKTALTSLPSP